MSTRVAIVDAAIDSAALLAEVAGTGVGATTLFVGTVRDVNEGRVVTGIEYSAYEPMAHAELQRIVNEAIARFESPDVIVVHRIGALGLGEASVAVVTAHAHRASALDAMRYVVEQLKARVPIWKRELYADGTREWVNAASALAAVVPAHDKALQLSAPLNTDTAHA